MKIPFEKNSWAVVTGASSGIGRALAERLAQHGMNLVMVAREGEKLSELSRLWQDTYGIQAHPVGLDLSDPDSPRKVYEEIEQRNLSIDLLVNAAGFGYFGDFQDMTEEQVTKMVQVNATAIVQLCHLFLPGMQARKKGAIVNVASIAGFVPYPFAAVYCATKSFLRLFTKALWAENKEKNVRIILLCPGYTKTNFERVSTEPSGIHFFSSEDASDIADKTLRRISSSGGCTLFTRLSHPFKILAAKILPSKLFAAILDHKRNRN